MTEVGRDVGRPAPAPRRTPPRKRRALMLKRAGQVFLERGFSEASMSEIAHAVGGSKGTLYAYFDSKDEIFAEFMAAEIGRRIKVTFTADPDCGVEEVLRAMGRRHLAMFSDHTAIALYRIAIHEGLRFPEIGRRFMEAGALTARGLLARYFRQAADSGVISIGDAQLAAQQFLALCQASLMPDLLMGTMAAPSPPEIERQVDLALNAFLAIYPPA